MEELLARLRATQRRLSFRLPRMLAASSVICKRKSLRVDYAGGCAYLDGRELHLTPIEIQAALLLSKNVGKVLTHTLSPKISGAELENDVASLRVFMARSERKLERNQISRSIFRPISESATHDEDEIENSFPAAG